VDPDPQPNSDQANSIWRVPAVVCRYVHDPVLCLAKVETAVRVDQGSQVAVAYALSYTRMLLAVLNGESVAVILGIGVAFELVLPFPFSPWSTLGEMVGMLIRALERTIASRATHSLCIG
jgi:hypothetical protein